MKLTTVSVIVTLIKAEYVTFYDTTVTNNEMPGLDSK